MRTPEEKYELMREQVIAKIYWGAPDSEVKKFMLDKHGIRGEEAETLLAEAYRTKRADVRKRAAVHLVCASIGLLAVAWFFWLQLYAGVIVIGLGTALAAALGVGCIGVILRSLFKLLTGINRGAVE